MVPSSADVVTSQPHAEPRALAVIRLVAGILLLAAAIPFTLWTIQGLAARRQLRMELAEISHVRYGVLNADRWVEKMVPILDARIDAIDFTKSTQADLRPTVERALYRLLDDVKAKMSAPPPAPPKPAAGGAPGTSPAPAPAGGGLGAFGGLLGLQGNSMIVNMIVGALKPHVPEYAGVVLAELGKSDTKDAIKKYIRTTLADGAKNTFGNVDMTWYNSILKQHGCADGPACQKELGDRVAEADGKIATDYWAVLIAAALVFLLLATERPVIRHVSVVVLLLTCVVLLVGGVLTPMIEVEARISEVSLTFLGSPIGFSNQVLYYQSKSVLEVFQTLIALARPDMWIVAVLVLMFSVVFPSLKILTSSVCLFLPRLLRNPLARFFVLESAKWSMADVMALAIFMSFVAFNGLILNTMSRLKETGVQVVIPTDSSKLLPGYYLFIGFCLASLLLSKKLGRALRHHAATTA